MTAARRGVNRIKRSRFKTDDKFVGALRAALREQSTRLEQERCKPYLELMELMALGTLSRRA
jgi:hypothetical protein